MARLLYWNINNFTERKIYPFPGEEPYDAGWDDDETAWQRREMILETFQPDDPGTSSTADLDFIVIVEVYARQGNREYQTVDGAGLDGVLSLLDDIRDQLPGGGAWCLVPPVVTGSGGRGEGVAVFYRSDRWYFLGPSFAIYPPEYKVGLPDRMDPIIPAGYPYRGGQDERRSCGQWYFPDAGGGALGFPEAGNRKPWLTAFGSIGNPTVMVRIMAVHTTPDRRGGPAFARAGTAALADIDGMTREAARTANQIDVILGDFNVDNTDPDNFEAPDGPFHRLVGKGLNPAAPPYEPLIRPRSDLDRSVHSYYHTHGKPAGDSGSALLVDGIGDPIGTYPGLGYSESSIDNVFVRYHGAGRAANTTILARAREQPYEDTRPPTPGLLLGAYGSVDDMEDAIDDLLDAAGPPNADDINLWFRGTPNYGLVYAVSDHFAIICDL